MTFLELVPIASAFMVWGLNLQNKKVNIHVDNVQSAKLPRIMDFNSALVLIASYEVGIKAAFEIFRSLGNQQRTYDCHQIRIIRGPWGTSLT